jgi:shikimate kinase
MKNIVLTGFMGTGKSRVGDELSRALGRQLIDVDSEIEKARGMSISEIFAKLGEPEFRRIETGMVKDISMRKNVVISTGGGVVLKEENMNALRENGVIVCLKASPGEILKRTEKNSERPLLQVDDPMRRIEELLSMRMPYYEKADIIIDTDGKTPREIADEILDRLRWKR